MNAALKWKLLAGFVLVFIAGIAAGAFLGAAQSRHHRSEFGRHHSLAERVRQHMEKRLALTPDQMAKTTPIFEKTARELEAIRVETGRRVHDTLAASDGELAPFLTPEQRAKLAALQADHHGERDKRDRRHGNHP